MRRAFFFFFIFILSSVSVAYLANPQEGFAMKRARVVTDLDRAISESVASGDYRCCISPACRMCYLGSWIWKDGICRCDDMIRQGQFDKVCPECKTGIEDGLCKSAGTESCPENAAAADKV